MVRLGRIGCVGEDKQELSQLRAIAHPLRVRILSLLTGEALSAAEVARRLDLTHANASYHLRVLHTAGELVVESQERVRGGMAKRYRYQIDDTPGVRSHPTADAHAIEAWVRSAHVEVARRAACVSPGQQAINADLEAWFEPEVWFEAVDLVRQAMQLLHARALPAGNEGALHASLTATGFVMTAQ